MPEPITVVLTSKRRRRAEAVQKLNHLLPAAGLLWSGLQAVRDGAHGFGLLLGVFEIVSAGALIALTVRELRGAPAHHHHPHAHPAVDWVDVAAGFMLVAEVLEHWHLTGHVKRPILLTALLTFAMGLSHGRLQRRIAAKRTLRVTDAGITVPARPFKARKIEATWRDLRSIEVGDRWAVVTMRTGRQRRLDLHDAEAEGAVRAALLEARDRLAAPGAPDMAE
jgi:hypothetical protein